MKTWPNLQALAILFEQKPLRERVLMLFAAVVLVFFLIDSLLVTPQAKRFKQLNAQMETLLADTEKSRHQIDALSAELAQHSDIRKKAELDKLIRLIAETDALLLGNAPFVAKRVPGYGWSDFDHLARVAEWQDRPKRLVLVR